MRHFTEQILGTMDIKILTSTPRKSTDVDGCGILQHVIRHGIHICSLDMCLLNVDEILIPQEKLHFVQMFCYRRFS